jgi:hypothetical protein
VFLVDNRTSIAGQLLTVLDVAVLLLATVSVRIAIFAAFHVIMRPFGMALKRTILTIGATFATNGTDYRRGVHGQQNEQTE